MSERRAIRAAVLLPALLALAVVPAGCGSRKAKQDVLFAEGPVPFESGLVRVVDNRFRPPEVTARPGEPMIWQNQGKRNHSATADPGQDVSFDTGTIEPGDKHRLKLQRSGTWAYHCRFHPYMRGRIKVVR